MVKNSFNHMSSTPTARPYLLINAVQNYAWGMRNESAFIARLLDLEPVQDEPYAELWMGVHPNGPSSLIDPERGVVGMAQWLSESPEERLSLKRSKVLSNRLPYLFKVLSADRMLSIQTHPNREQAISLHAQDPGHYPDNNHKPEIAIAIDSLDALVGFISDEAFNETLRRLPDLADLLNTKPGNARLKPGVLTLLNLLEHDPEKLYGAIESLCKQLGVKEDRTENENLLLQQAAVYGQSDIGLIFILLMNRVKVEAGHALFLGPGVPHAYLRGNIIECMANSDNVVRLGLTPKFCDPGALREILDFTPSDVHVTAETDGQLTEYMTPTDEFRVKSLALDAGESYDFQNRDELALFLVLQGEIKLHWCGDESTCCSIFSRGDAFVTPANLSEFSIQTRSDSLVYLVEMP